MTGKHEAFTVVHNVLAPPVRTPVAADATPGGADEG